MADLTCSLLDLTLRNPIVLASGILGTSAALLERVARAGAGAVTAKSCGPTPRAGHPNPIVVEWGHGLINAVGLTNPGATEEVPLLEAARASLDLLGVPLFASIFGGTPDEYAAVARAVAAARPALIEVNISCPNVADEYGTPFAADPVAAAEVTAAAKAGAAGIPISVKLAPSVPDIGRIARAAVSAGADALTAINTMPGMVIDPYAAQPVLANRTGGLSGAAIKPIALRCVAQLASEVDVPIIGTGGVLSGVDAAEMLMAGATAVGVGSAVWYKGPGALGEIAAGLAAFMADEGYTTLAELRGRALRAYVSQRRAG